MLFCLGNVLAPRYGRLARKAPFRRARRRCTCRRGNKGLMRAPTWAWYTYTHTIKSEHSSTEANMGQEHRMQRTVNSSFVCEFCYLSAEIRAYTILGVASPGCATRCCSTAWHVSVQGEYRSLVRVAIHCQAGSSPGHTSTCVSTCRTYICTGK